MNCNRKAFVFLERAAQCGRSPIVLYGGRRAAKSYSIAQWLLLRIYNECEQVQVVSVTDTQGREGAYADMCEIAVEFGDAFEIHKTPREFITNFKRNGRQGRVRFQSFDDSAKAKGGAVDWVWLNEGNLLTYQHYIDISVNARKGVIIDFNPTGRFWLNDLVSDDDCLRMTWLDNVKHLTATQIAWFEKLKAKAEAPNATSADVYFYRVNYLGEYGELNDTIFNAGNLPIIDEQPPKLRKYIIACDPSALCGADYFACVFGGIDSDGLVWVLDTFSKNACDEAEILQQLWKWCEQVDVSGVYVETNGISGINFYNRVRKSDMQAKPFCSRTNKFERIVANFGGITKDVRFCRHENAERFMAQVYDFKKKCEHDDNVDALNTFYTLLKFY